MSFKYKDCKITVSYLFVVVITVLLLQENTKLLLFAITSSILHECGHLIAAILIKYHVKQFSFTPFGAKIELKMDVDKGYLKDIIVYLCGPLVNILLFSVSTMSGHDNSFALCNLLIAIFNLLPIYSLDGGNIIYSICCLFTNSKQSEKVIIILSFIFLMPLLTVSFFILIKSKYNFTLLLTALYLIYGVCVQNRDKIITRPSFHK